jgi:N-acetyl-gamma-glutamyl-phosphate reductase
MPLCAHSHIQSAIHISAITGSTGAGQTLTDTTHFSWRYSNISVYKAFEHQHLSEIKNLLFGSKQSKKSELFFLPFRGNFTRGILAASYLSTNLTLAEIKDLYNSAYDNCPFVLLTEINPDIKQVVNTNKCIIQLQKHADTLLIISALDNMIKGAAGQAVQNMNVMFGFDQSSGLNLKASVF